MRIVGDLCSQWDMAFSPKFKDAKLQARRACQTQLHDAATGKRAQGHGCEGWLFISHTVRILLPGLELEGLGLCQGRARVHGRLFAGLGHPWPAHGRLKDSDVTIHLAHRIRPL
jgi:hypothetical protein